MISPADLEFLREAYRVAAAATGNCDPNPAVGAVLVDAHGQVLSRGATQRAGFAHAERVALNAVGPEGAANATLYVTLEPCCHFGRTPPCTDAIIENRVGRVVIAERDFAAEVAGRSVELLRAAGVTVDVAEAVNFQREKWYTTGPFFFARQMARPRVVLKWAQTRDGCLAPAEGPSGPISGSAAMAVTATLRSWCKLTVASAATAQIDRPRLTVRFPSDMLVLQNSGLSAQFLAICAAHSEQKDLSETMTDAYKPPSQRYLQRGENFQQVLQEILRQGYNSLLIEAGPRFSQAVLDGDLVDALAIYRSRENTAQSLWGKSGRGNAVCHSLAGAAEPVLAGFELIEQADLGADEFLFFRRVRDD